MTPPARLYARLRAARPLTALPGRRARREAARRAEKAAHPTVTGPLINACCTTWPDTSGRTHDRTCHNVTEEIDQ